MGSVKDGPAQTIYELLGGVEEEGESAERGGEDETAGEAQFVEKMHRMVRFSFVFFLCEA